MNAALSEINLGIDVEDEIRAAALAGMEITTHSDLISYEGITTSGYIIIDSDSGAGAYKISGGSDGALFLGSAIGSIIALSSAHNSAYLNNAPVNKALLQTAARNVGIVNFAMSIVFPLFDSDCSVEARAILLGLIITAAAISMILAGLLGTVTINPFIAVFINTLFSNVFSKLIGQLRNELCQKGQ